MKIAIVGTGYVGLTSGTCLAELGNDVICVDIDADKINKLNNSIIPIYEPGLEELVVRNKKDGRLRFTTDLKKSIKESEIIFICVGTPPKENGEADLSHVENVAKTIADAMDSYKVIVEKSTVPVQTGEDVQKTIKACNRHEVEFDVVSNPEFLREGSAVNDFMHPDRIVIGCESEKAKEIMKALYEPLKAPIIFTDIKSAEIIKHASNSFLAAKISFINAIANICEAAGADVEKVAEGMGYDKRIGRAFLNAGIGYGGFCLSGEEYVFLGNPNPKLTNFKEAFESNSNSKNIIALAFDGKKAKLSDVGVISKRQYNKEIIKINTSMGRSIEVTANHPMIVEKNGKLEVKESKDLIFGDKIPIIMNLPERVLKSIDVLELLPEELKKKLKLRPKNKKLLDYKAELWSHIKCESWRKFDFFRKNYITYQYYTEIKSILKNFHMLLFTSKGNATYFPAKIELNEAFWRLIGYYLSEGHIHHEKQKRGVRSRIVFTFNEHETEYINDVCNILNNLSIKYEKGNYSHTTRVVVSSRIFAYLLEKVLGCGTDSYNAKIPNIAFLQYEKSKKALLCGLFRGDGYAYFHKNAQSVTIEYGTCSRTLAEGIILLLQSLGIIPSYKKQFMKKSKVDTHIIRVHGKNQVKKLIFFDKKTNVKIRDCLQKCKTITPMGYTIQNNIGFLKINKIEKFVDNRYVYSIELNDEPHMFVTSGGIIVHNCFPKDTEAFIRISEKFGYDFKLLKAVQEINNVQRKHFTDRIKRALLTVNGKTIGILGLAFKPNTDDMRFAPSVDIITELQKKGAKIKAYDPKAMEKAKSILKNVEHCSNPYDAAKDADALVIITEWDEFKKLELKRIKSLMKHPLVIDGRNIYKPEDMKNEGFTYISIGRKDVH